MGIKVALYQMNIKWEDKEHNIAKAKNAIEVAKNNGCDVVFFPEMSFTGFSMNIKVTAEIERTIQIFSKIAKKSKIAIGFGWVKSAGVKAENHYTVISSEGSIISDYSKIHPFSYANEDKYFIGGNTITSFQIGDFVMSNFICYDLRFPEIFCQASKTAHAIVVPANWPERRKDHWITLLKARAIENQVYMIGVNCVGEIDQIDYSGNSCIVSPEGEIIEMLENKEDIIICELNNNVPQYRKNFPVYKDRKEELYKSFLGNS